ncbi:MAG: rhodanese-like domain-containing protein, partial [Alphaproteobacteria bacterium]
MPTTTSPQTLKAMLIDGQELALLDVREEGEFGEGHMLYATPKPYSIFERGLSDLVPRLSVRTVLVDGGDGVAEAVANRMEAIGYTNVAILAGGVDAWRAAGFEIFQGVNVPSKAFGEVVEVTAHTPAIPAETLTAMQAAGEDLVVLDGRTPEEFTRMSIPGGISVPNAELVYRIHDLAPDPATTVIVNCAGRTRSIIGAQALINAGVPNRVVALQGGTMGWRLAGLQLNHGRTDQFPPLSEAGRTKAIAYAADVRHRFNVPMASPQTIKAWMQDTSRTTYLLDVRSEEEFEAGHMPGARHAPGGQLVQGADQWCGVKGGRIVLLDAAANVRATLTGHWLVPM